MIALSRALAYFAKSSVAADIVYISNPFKQKWENTLTLICCRRYFSCASLNSVFNCSLYFCNCKSICFISPPIVACYPSTIPQKGGQPQQSTYYSLCVTSLLAPDTVQPPSRHFPFPSLICGPSSWRHPSSFPDTGDCPLHSSPIGAYLPYLSPLQISPLINSGLHRLGRRSFYRRL